MFRRTDKDVHGKYVDSKHFNRILFQSILLPIALSVIIAAMFVYQLYNVLGENNKVRHSDEILSLSSQSMKMILDTETGLRGFIITGNEAYLEPWQVSMANFDITFSKLLMLVRDNPQQQQELKNIFLMYSDWVRVAEKNIFVRRESEGAKKKGTYLLRKELMDKIRKSFDEFDTRESVIRKKRWLETESATRRTLFTIILTGISLGVVLAIISTKQLRKLSSSYNETLESLSVATEHLEETVAKRTLELSAVNKELEAFSYSVSHDLRAPLRGIDGFSQILVEDYGDKLDGEAHRYLGFIRSGVQKMGVLIDDLINLSRLTRSEFKKEKVNISELAEEIINDLKLQHPDRKVDFINLKNEIVQGDMGLMRAALQNLISNAWKYSGTRENAVIELGKTEKDNHEAYYVKDNGVGFDMRFYDKLFQPFQRLHPKEKFDGTGIGLATVARIVRRHGGIIWADSVVGEGTTFYFTLNV